jgi:hypothetical protein
MIEEIASTSFGLFTQESQTLDTGTIVVLSILPLKPCFSGHLMQPKSHIFIAMIFSCSELLFCVPYLIIFLTARAASFATSSLECDILSHNSRIRG